MFRPRAQRINSQKYNRKYIIGCMNMSKKKARMIDKRTDRQAQMDGCKNYIKKRTDRLTDARTNIRDRQTQMIDGKMTNKSTN